MSTLLVRALNRTRPREGWPVLILVLLAVLCAPLALWQIVDTPGTDRLIWLTLAGTLAGLALARSRASGRAAAAAGIVLGGGLMVVFLGEIVPPLSLLWAEGGYALSWLRGWIQGTPPAGLPFAATAGFVWQRLVVFAGRVAGWAMVASGAAPAPEAPDQTGFLLLMAVIAWGAGLFAGWYVFRRRSPLIGLLPSGAGIVLVVFLSGSGRVFLLLYLGCMLGIIAAMHLWSRQQSWEQRGVDYPDNLGVDLALVVLPWLLVAVLVAAVFPYIRSRPVSRAFWRAMDRPWQAVEVVTLRIFGVVESRYEGQGGVGVLPRDHLLAGSPNLDDVIVLYVTTNDPPPPPPELEEVGVSLPSGPRRYWRGVVYDTYTGLGWDHRRLLGRPLQPDQLLESAPQAGFELQQTFEAVGPDNSRLYAVNAPLSVDQAVQAWWRAPGDLAYLEASARRYSVISRPPEPTVRELRLAPTVPPPAGSLMERYLALPETLPPRVRELAQDVTADANTQFDQALAIESLLRTYTYTLDLPLPPQDRDLVDYFLFDRKEGYCDYYSSAMVVMARALGIPARFASGYAQGAYDHNTGRWVVKEINAHSWPELYFEGIGWVEFEPTAGQPALVRPLGAGPGDLASQPAPASGLAGERWLWPLLAVGAILVLLVAGIAAIWWPRQATAQPAAEVVRDRYRRLMRWGHRLREPAAISQTPHEYGTTLGRALAARGSSSRSAMARDAAGQVPEEVQALTDSFVQAQYSSRPLPEREGWRIRALWERLRRHLWWLLFH